MTAPERPLSLRGRLAREFPAWQLAIRPGGLDVLTAYWCSADGRSRRYIVARSAPELLARLRAAVGEPPAFDAWLFWLGENLMFTRGFRAVPRR